MVGIITELESEAHAGKIEGEDGRIYEFGQNDVGGHVFNLLREGDTVSFIPQERGNRPKAVHIHTGN